MTATVTPTVSQFKCVVLKLERLSPDGEELSVLWYQLGCGARTFNRLRESLGPKLRSTNHVDRWTEFFGLLQTTGVVVECLGTYEKYHRRGEMLSVDVDFSFELNESI